MEQCLSNERGRGRDARPREGERLEDAARARPSVVPAQVCMHIFEYSRMEYEIIVPEEGVRAAKAATTDYAAEMAKYQGGVGYKIFDVQKHHGVSLAAKAYASAWALPRAVFDAVFYFADGPKISAFGYGVTNGGGGAVTCPCCCACPASQSSRSSSIH